MAETLYMVIERFRNGDPGPVANWSDLVEFEVHPVITSAEAAEQVAP
jgi:hypothetical protein